MLSCYVRQDLLCDQSKGMHRSQRAPEVSRPGFLKPKKNHSKAVGLPSQHLGTGWRVGSTWTWHASSSSYALACAYASFSTLLSSFKEINLKIKNTYLEEKKLRKLNKFNHILNFAVNDSRRHCRSFSLVFSQ